MSTRLKLTSVTKTLLLKGRSDYRRKISGDFSCSLGGVEFHGLRISEGHMSTRDIGVSRVLWIECGLDEWNLDQLFPSGDEFALILRSEAEDVVFFVQRVTPAVEAAVDLSSFPKWVRGQASLDGIDDSVFEVFEPNSNRKRVYLSGDSATLKHVAMQVQAQGSCEIVIHDV